MLSSQMTGWESFFEPCTIASVQLPPPLKPNQGERLLRRAAVNIVFLWTFAYFFGFSLTPDYVLTTLEKDVCSYLDSIAKL